METTEKESNNEIIKTKLANGINVEISIRVIPRNEATPEQLLKWDKAMDIFYGRPFDRVYKELAAENEKQNRDYV
ncbi:MAG TPA: hypothetical protein VF596_04830 [Pyrinomonadaceae bacterium]|jgi:hypothetical protein